MTPPGPVAENPGRDWWRSGRLETRTLSVDLPEELIDLLGSPEAAAQRARESLVLDLLRDAKISQGKAARLLGITRWDIIDLMAHHRIPSGPETAEEMRAEIEDLQRFVEGH